MKTFSELLDIEYNIPIEIVVDPKIGNGSPNVCININNKILYDGVISNSIVVSYSVSLLEPICISISMTDKKYDMHKETAIIIASLKIDRCEYIPKCNHVITYENDHNITTTSNYLGYNGTWVLDINEPYYIWKHHMFDNGWIMDA